MQKQRRRWFQYSLRTLLIAVTIASAAGSWLGQKLWEARRQKQAIEAIQKIGGIVGYDYQIDSEGNFNNLARSPVPGWLRSLCGDDLFANVTYVYMCGTHATDETLVHFRSIPKVRSLTISYTKITDDGLINLQELTELQELRMSHVPVTDTGVAYLKKLEKLRELDLAGTKITAACLPQLVNLQQLEQLNLYRTQASDAEFESLRNSLPKLEKND